MCPELVWERFSGRKSPDTTLHCPRPLMGMFTVYPIFLAHLSDRISKGEVSKGHR